MPGRFDWIKIFNRFCKNFQDLLLNSDNVDDVKILSGGSDVELIHKNGAEKDVTISSPSERFKILTKKLGDQHLVCVRNMSDDTKVVDLGWKTDGLPILKGVELRTHECFTLPIGVKIPYTDITVVRSNSSLLFAHKVDGHVVFGLFGKPGRKGETVLNVPASDVKVLSGNVQVGGGAQATLSYTHDGMYALKVRNHILVILDQKLASKVEEVQDGVMIADTYFVRDISQSGNTITIKTEMRNDSRNRFSYIGNSNVAAVRIDGQNVAVKKGAGAGMASFEYQNPADKPVAFEWLGDWKAKPDVDEADPKYKDGDWTKLDKPISLEEAGLLQHGYLWFRMDFRLPKDAKDLNLMVPGNNADRFTVYVNGKEKWCGITNEAWIGIQDDAKPGKNVVAVAYENFYHNKSHPHEGAIQKYSGIMAPVIVKGKDATGKEFKRKVTKMRVREQLTGNLKGYENFDFDDSGWIKLVPAKKYVMAHELGHLMWMRRKFKFQCKPGWKCAVKLTIPNAKDRLVMYVNGRPLGQFEYVGPQYDFYIPETFLKEENVLSLVLQGNKTFMDTARGYLREPVLGTFYEAKEVDIQVTLGR